MSRKQLAVISAFAALLLLIQNSSFASAASSDATQTNFDDDGKSYFGYRPPKPHDSYKKLVQELNEFGTVYSAEWQRLFDRVEELHKRLYYRKDKDYGGSDYGKLQKMQDLLREQKATIDALRNERIKVPAV